MKTALQSLLGERPAAYLAARNARNKCDNNRHVVRPFEVDNTFKTYNNTAHASGIFTAAFRGNASILNYGILLYFPDNLLENPDECVRLVPPVNWLLLARHGELDVAELRPEISKALDLGLEELAIALLSSMERGYIRIYLDEYYIPLTGHYRKKHYKHETLVCGFDADKGAVVIAAWDKQGEFRMIRVPFYAFLQSVKSEKGWPEEWGYRDRFDQDGYYSNTLRKPIYCIKIRSDKKSSLDKNLIKAQIQDALMSRCTYSHYIGDPMTDWHEDTGSYGLAAYEAFANYADLCATKGRRIDPRVSRLFWEHKVIMTERLAMLRLEGASIPPAIDIAYQKASFIARKVHLMLFQNAAQGEASDAVLIRKEMHRMSALERETMDSLLKFL